MPGPRVLPVVGIRVGRVYVPDWPGWGRPPASGLGAAGWARQRWVAWRLLAGNGWEIGRSASVYPDREFCRAAVTAVSSAIQQVEWTTSRGVGSDQWSWEMTLEGELVAVASRFYKLQRECESAARRFLTVLPVAELPRDWSNTSVTLPRQLRAVLTDERTASGG